MVKNLFSKVLRARVTEEIYNWFEIEAKNRNISVSEFIRTIPALIKELELQLDDKDNTIESLKNVNKTDNGG